MTRLALRLGKGSLALAVLATTTTWASAQSTSGYPYWDSAPSSYRGSDIDYATRPLPGPQYDPFRPTGWVYGGVGPVWLSPGSWSYSYLANVHSSGAGRVLPFSDSTLTERPTYAHISLEVPTDAQVWFDGDPTRHTGTLRNYVSPPLTPGPTYTYTLRVRWMKDGTPVEETRRVKVHAGELVRLTFPASAANRVPGP
jgi:uncharacterized protein (TIGR03000 family)